MINIFIGDDHEIVRDGLKSLLNDVNDMKVIGEGGNGREVIENMPESTDVVLIDINMPMMNGIETARYLTKNFEKTKILAFSMIDDENMISEIFSAGASGYLLKNTGKDELMYAIRRINGGGMYIAPEIAVRILDKFTNKKISEPISTTLALSKREVEVLNHLADGLTNNEIAEKLFASRRTIETHRKNLIEKTGAKNTASLIRYAINSGLLK